MSSRSKPQVARVLERDKFKCQYCGCPVDASTVRLDHIEPRVKGGKTRDYNLASSCARCNSFKYHFTIEEFLDRLESKYIVAKEQSDYYQCVLVKMGRIF